MRIGLLAVLIIGCAHAPTSATAQDDLKQRAQIALDNMRATNSNLQPALDQAAGYVVFPDAFEAAFFGGAGGGTGVVYQHGQPIGFAELNEGSFGGEAGAEKFAEVIVIHDQATLEAMRNGKLKVAGDASAIIGNSGTAKAFNAGDNVMVFVQPLSGAEVKASLIGQRVKLIF
jgi:lipid-binding SYLF domain-containing protein